MKKARLLIALLVMLVAASGYAQDTYRDAIKKYLSFFGKTIQMENSLREINGTVFMQNDKVDLEMLTERYLQEVYEDQMADVFESMMKERDVTEADLRTIIAMAVTPEGQTYLAHENEWNEKLSEVSTEYMSQLLGGGEPEKLQVNPDIDAVYAAKFQKLWKDCGIEEKTVRLLDGAISGEMSGETSAASKLKTFADNLGTMALNAAYGSMTLEDFDFGMKLYSNESFRKATDTSDMNLYSLMGIGAEVIMKYLDWMESQGAQPNENLQSFKMLRSLMESKRNSYVEDE